MSQINITPNSNEVNLVNNNNQIIIIDNNCNTSVTVTQPLTSVIEVSTGPRGYQGPTGSAGPTGSSQPFSLISGSTWGTTSSIEITGSLTISGYNTFKNIGPAIFTGSVDITGSLNVNGNTSGSFTGSLLGTASYANQALTASYALNVIDTTFPYTGSAIISGSLLIIGSSSIQGTNTGSSNLFQLDVDGTGKTLGFYNWGGGSYSVYGWGIRTSVDKLRIPNTIYIGDSSYYINRFIPATGPVGSYGGAFNTYTDFKATSLSSSRVFIYGEDLSGNVGIGITSPQYKLDVSGSGRFTNNLNVTGSAIISGSLELTGSLSTNSDISLTGGSRLITSNNGNLRLNAPVNSSVRLDVSGNPIMTVSANNISTTGSFNITGSLIVSQNITSSTMLVGGSGSNAFFDIQANTNSSWFRVSAGNISFNSQGGTTTAGGASSIARFNIGSLSSGTNVLSLQGVSGQTGDILRVDKDNTTVSGSTFIIKGTGNVGIGTTSPTVGFQGVITNGAFLFSDASSSITDKNARWGVPHYTGSTEENFYGIVHSSYNNNNDLQLGGGTSQGNAATTIKFFTAPNFITTTGTERARINSSGYLLIGRTSSMGSSNGATGKLQVFGDIDIAGPNNQSSSINFWTYSDANPSFDAFIKISDYQMTIGNNNTLGSYFDMFKMQAGTFANTAATEARFWNFTGTSSQSQGASYTGLKLNITESSIGSGSSYLMRLQTNGVDRFRVDRTGSGFFSGSLSATSFTGSLLATSGIFTNGLEASGSLNFTGSLNLTGSINALVTGSSLVNIGNLSPTTASNQRLITIGQDNAWMSIGSLVGTPSINAIYFNQTSPNSSNYSIYGSSNTTLINADSTVGSVGIRVNNSTILNIDYNSIIFQPITKNSGIVTPFTFITPFNTGQTSATEIPNFKISGSNKTWNSGSIAVQRWNWFTGNTASFNGSSTIGESFGLFAEAAAMGTNATCSNNYAFGVSGSIKFANLNSSIFCVDTTGVARSILNFNLGENIVLTGKPGTTDIILNPTNGGVGLYVKGSNGSIGAGVASPTALFHLRPGSVLSSAAPLKFSTGSFQTTPELGAVEFNGQYLTITTGSTRNLLLHSNNPASITGSLTTTGSQNIIGSLTASKVLFSSSGVSQVTIIGSGSSAPLFTIQGSQGELFSINDSLSGSLFSVNDISGLPIFEVFSDSKTIIGDFQAPSLYTTKKITANSGSNIIYNLPTSSYDSIFYDYSIKSGSDYRTGHITATWSGSSISYIEHNTSSLGSPSGFLFGVFITGSNVMLTGSSTTNGWTVKTIIRSI